MFEIKVTISCPDLVAAAEMLVKALRPAAAESEAPAEPKRTSKRGGKAKQEVELVPNAMEEPAPQQPVVLPMPQAMTQPQVMPQQPVAQPQPLVQPQPMMQPPQPHADAAAGHAAACDGSARLHGRADQQSGRRVGADRSDEDAGASGNAPAVRRGDDPEAEA